MDGATVNQTSNFSYNWFKTIKQKDNSGNTIQQIQIPIISNKEVWDDNSDDYREMLKKTYTNYAQRFWYIDGNKFYEIEAILSSKAQKIFIPKLFNSLLDEYILTLNYKNEPSSILQTYFNVIAPNDSNYTDIECYLSPDEYEQLNGSKLVKLNNDLYYIGSIEGYDPLGQNKTKLKLIRKV